MKIPFHEKRRQQFLTLKFYNSSVSNITTLSHELRIKLEGGSGDLEDKRSWAFFLSNDSYRRFSIRYTAGESIENLRLELGEVIESYERYQKALAAYEKVPEISPLGLDQLADYERAMQLIGLCILLHRPDLLQRVSALIDPGYEGEDTLYEDLLSFYQPDRTDLDEWYHEEPYTPLIHAMYEEDKKAAADHLLDYCKRWYPAFKYAPWHDGHLRIDGTEGNYFGYWAFEAGAVAYLLDLDDSGIDHLVYPKDLVAWARANKHLSQSPGDDLLRGRCEAGQPCPREGFWFTPAQQSSRQFFRAGDVMPAVGGNYGATIWQWDMNQEMPKL